MGYYVNPVNESKEDYLERIGIQVDKLSWEDIPSGCLPVVLINNGMFTAAGVAYDRREYEEFTNPRDVRQKKLYIVEIGELLKVTDGLAQILPDFRKYI
jgi:hypothetical protein